MSICTIPARTAALQGERVRVCVMFRVSSCLVTFSHYIVYPGFLIAQNFRSELCYTHLVATTFLDSTAVPLNPGT